ncbi:universal stress protein [Shouchella shacheensis]|uniref:universal stress protein n=1 Tax=Shouchella shacheensis TaxID=1649580 RepID=UPI0007402408|nr:universal stress protein [Shouchella shacheensis]
MSSSHEQERILVCVNYGHNGSRLIKRGAKLAHQLEAPLSILVFDSLPEDEFKHDKEVDMSIFQELADEAGAEVIIEKSRAPDIKKIITKAAKEKEATQIIIGQVVESLWTNLLGRSIIDVLLHEVPFADLHVVPKQRSGEEDDWNFERGVHAFLLAKDDGTYELHFDDIEGFTYEGVFFKSLHTDFDNGIFAFTQDHKVFEVRVDENIVHELVDVDES